MSRCRSSPINSARRRFIRLGDQRLPADDHDPSVAARSAWRSDRLQVHLHPGIWLFTLGSVACAAGGTLTLLVAARVFQGIGAACIMSMNAALVRATYPAKMLGRGIGYNAMVLSMSAATGPTLAAIILSVASWQWLFLINLPIGIAALIVGRKALQTARAWATIRLGIGPPERRDDGTDRIRR